MKQLEITPKETDLVGIEIPTSDLHSCWHRCSEISNYLAAYVASEYENPDRALNITTVVVNELLEYLFDSTAKNCSVFISLCKEDSELIIRCKSRIIQNSIEHLLKNIDEEFKNIDNFWSLKYDNHNQLRFAFLVYDYECQFQVSKEENIDQFICRLNI